MLIEKLITQEIDNAFPGLSIEFTHSHLRQNSFGYHYVDLKVVSYAPFSFGSLTDMLEKYFATHPFGESFEYVGFRKRQFKVFATQEDFDKNNVPPSAVTMFWEKTEDYGIYSSAIDLGLEAGWTFKVE